MNPITLRKFMSTSASALGLAGLVALTACAIPERPVEQMAVSKAAVSNAQTAGGSEAAPYEMTLATEKMAKANIAISNKEYETARALALEAQLDAKLAQIKSSSSKAQKAASELEAASRVLSDEMNRRLK
jgi:aspartate/tyrosine/aromatic aminotransferase